MKVSVFRVKFVGVCEWFDGCGRLKITFTQPKTRLPKCPLF